MEQHELFDTWNVKFVTHPKMTYPFEYSSRIFRFVVNGEIRVNITMEKEELLNDKPIFTSYHHYRLDAAPAKQKYKGEYYELLEPLCHYLIRKYKMRLLMNKY